jgi:CDP-glycerol glycerophosphotransferase (TagB/SpsB family)
MDVQRVELDSFPKEANLVIFGSNEGKHFSDNSRSLFEYTQANDELDQGRVVHE